MRIIVTGVAGFIGYHVADRLLRDGYDVVGIDNFTPYYDVRLKRHRLALLNQTHEQRAHFTFHQLDICEHAAMQQIFLSARPACVIHLAAQAGIRYSLTNPFAYQTSNLEGFLSVLECCRHAAQVPRLIYASSSSVYGGNTQLPFSESQAVDHPVSLYAATKRSNELMAHAYTHLYGFQTIGLRFFTVYGPWYRPDMALYLFADALTQGRPLKVFNKGEMRRDFTYIDDIVDGVCRCVHQEGLAAYEIFNIGNNQSERLLDVIELLASELGVTPHLELWPLQDGDVVATWADIDKIRTKTGYQPTTSIQVGVPKFIAWYQAYTAQRG